MIIDMELWKEIIFGHKAKNLCTAEENLQAQARINFNKNQPKTEVDTEWLLGILREVDVSREDHK
jgi:hypothetical protein